MTSIVDTVIHAFQSMLTDFVQLVKDILARFETIGQNTFNELRTISQEVFTSIRNRISNMLTSVKGEISALRFHGGHAGSESISFVSKVESLLRRLIADAQTVFDRVKAGFTVVLTDSKDAMEHVEGELGPVTKDVGGFIDDSVRDFIAALKDVGSRVDVLMSAAVHDISHVVEVSADFAKQHGVQIAEAAVITAIQPSVVLGFAVAGGFVFLSTVYEPSA